MSEENAEVVVAAYEAFAARGVDGFGEFLTDDVDYRAVEGAPDDRGPMHGKEALRPDVQDWLDTFDEFTAQPVELVDAGENPSAAKRMFRDLETTRGEPEQTERAAWFNGPLPIPDTARAEGH